MTQEHVFPDRVAYLHGLMEACDQLEAMGLLETIGIDPVTGVKRRRSEILAEVEALASARLFGPGPWLGEDSDQLCKWFMQVGLEEPVPGEKDTWRATVLGRELHVDLLTVFLGLFSEYDIPEILRQHEFIDHCEVQHIWNLLDAGHDPETVLKKYVLDAYRGCHKTGIG